MLADCGVGAPWLAAGGGASYLEVHGSIFGVRACDLGFVYLEVDGIVTVLMQAMVICGLELYILLGFSFLFFGRGLGARMI